MDIVFAVFAFIAYFLSIRCAYYYLVTRTPFKMREHDCIHGYSQLHKGESCHKVDEGFTRGMYVGLSFLGPLLCLGFIPIGFLHMAHGVSSAITWKQPAPELGPKDA